MRFLCAASAAHFLLFERVMNMEKNQIKFNNYKEQSKRLEKALKYEFYVEALAIEYAMIEDRIQSIFKHSGFDVFDRNGVPFSIQRNINRLKTNKYFNEPNIRKKVPLELVCNIEDWKNRRNRIMHALMKADFKSGEFRELAIEGNELKKAISSKSLLIKRFNDKLKNEKE